MSSYEPVPTNDSNSNLPPPKPSNSKFSSRKLILALAFCLVALGFFKAGQWSVWKSHPEPAAASESSTSVTEPIELDKEPPKEEQTDTDMEAETRGKYSVG